MTRHLLAVDAGNTNTVFAVFEGEAIKGVWRIATRAHRTADEYAAMLSQLMALKRIGLEDVGDVVISSVVPHANFALRTLCRQYFHCDPLMVNQETQLGIKVFATGVGADRLVNAVAGHVAYTGPLIIIDFGTATTFDVVDADGNYCGGIIAPGINLALEALHQAAASLPRIAVEKPAKVIGNATVPAMQSGVYWGYVGLIEGLVQRIKDEFGKPMKVVATGGLAPVFDAASRAIDHVDRDLTIRGLREIFRRNVQGRG